MWRRKTSLATVGVSLYFGIIFETFSVEVLLQGKILGSVPV